ncbi:MAG: hypothetical protein HYU41_14900 [Candidatus Rokubacteria bacterium]|nr:hypothetical protein [Candidatus Rokubacteria bacterium]
MAAVIGLAIAGATVPASAFVAHITTSVPVHDVSDEAQLRDAVVQAVEDVLKETIDFEPALIVVTRALLLGDRLYIQLLVADDEGARVFDEPDTMLEREGGTTEL